MTIAVRPRSPISRRGGPITSHEAADLVTLSGKRDAQAQRVYEALRHWPGRTSAELADLMCESRYMTARRLPELRAGGWVTSMAPRRCAITRRRALAWRVLNPDEQLPLDLGCPESHSDMQGAVRGLLRMFDVKRRPIALTMAEILTVDEEP